MTSSGQITDVVLWPKKYLSANAENKSMFTLLAWVQIAS